MSWAWLAITTCWMILVTGLGQNAARVAVFAAGRPWDHGEHTWWMAPLGDAMVYAVVLLLLAATMRLVPGVRNRHVVFAVLLFPAALTAVMLVPRLHLLARLVLATGIAVQGARLASRHAIVYFGMRRTLFPLLVLTTVLAILGMARPAILARQRPPAPDPPAGAPNVLVLLWDTARASSMSLYGHGEPTTPHLELLARAGVAFERAISTASYTLPSHASLFTGRWAHELSADWQVPLDAEHPTLAEVLRAHGYRTAAFSANRFYVTRGWGLARGFDRFDEHRLGVEQVVRSSTLARTIVTSEAFRRLFGFDDDLARVMAADNHRALVGWLDSSDRTRPYFAFVNFMEAHGPYLPNAPFDTAFGWYDGRSAGERRVVRRAARREPESLAPDEAGRLRAAYHAAIAELDAAVADLLADLEARGDLNNTIVIVTADHGEEFGEHGLYGHGNSLYFESIHVPLVVWAPGRVPAGRRVPGTVSNRDVAATVLELAGLPPELPGNSLRVTWENDAVPDTAIALSHIRDDLRLPEVATSRLGDVSSVVGESVHIIRNADGTLSVFDLDADPHGRVPGDTSMILVSRIATHLPPRSTP